MNKIFKIVLAVMIAVAAFSPGAKEIVKAGTIPTFSIVSVDENNSVTIKTYNFPKDRDFRVLMGKFGTRGINGTLVTTTVSGEGGSLTLTYNIPDSVKGLDRIAIRLEATSGGYYAYNWFWNDTTGSTDPSEPEEPEEPANPGYSGIPTFSIVSVDAGKTVTIKTNNFPKDVDFRVLMGKFGTQGINGSLVTTTDSANGGSLTLTYNIPDSVKGLDRIAIRLEATSGGYYAYNWFWNDTTGTTDPSDPDEPEEPVNPGYSGIPTFSIVSVSEDSTVTIKTNNFPKDVDFRVLMGKFGTKGIDGTQVTTTDSEDGGTLTLTYNIPDSVKGLDRIAIRLEATSGGYYAYNWFWNNPAP